MNFSRELHLARAEERGDWAKVKRVGLFGGSFDPVHIGHLHAASAAQAAFGLERVVFVPAASPPHKPARALASGPDRAHMLALAIAGRRDWSISNIELDRPGLSYTIDTLRELPGRLLLTSDAKLFLILGSDNLRGFERWKDVHEILERAEPIVVLRDAQNSRALEQIRSAFAPSVFARIERGLLGNAPLVIDATSLRAALARGETPSGMDAEVVAYARERALYGAPSQGRQARTDQAGGN